MPHPPPASPNTPDLRSRFQILQSGYHAASENYLQSHKEKGRNHGHTRWLFKIAQKAYVEMREGETEWLEADSEWEAEKREQPTRLQDGEEGYDNGPERKVGMEWWEWVELWVWSTIEATKVPVPVSILKKPEGPSEREGGSSSNRKKPKAKKSVTFDKGVKGWDKADEVPEWGWNGREAPIQLPPPETERAKRDRELEESMRDLETFQFEDPDADVDEGVEKFKAMEQILLGFDPDSDDEEEAVVYES